MATMVMLMMMMITSVLVLSNLLFIKQNQVYQKLSQLRLNTTNCDESRNDFQSVNDTDVDYSD